MALRGGINRFADNFESNPQQAVKSIFASKGAILTYIILGILFALLVFNPIVMIPAGHRGVVLNFGAVDDKVLAEGINWRTPIVQSIVKMDVQIQKSQVEAAAASKDLQDTHSIIALNYHVQADKVNWVYQNIGVDYRERIIDPAVQEVIKAVAAKYTAVELINKREAVSTETKEHLAKRLSSYFIAVDAFSIINFRFSPEFTKSIEEKQTAEQKALKAQNDLKRIQVEAEQKVATAKAEAEALRLQKENVSENLIRLRQVEASIKATDKWNGQLPQVSAGAIPFIDVNRYAPVQVK